MGLCQQNLIPKTELHPLHLLSLQGLQKAWLLLTCSTTSFFFAVILLQEQGPLSSCPKHKAPQMASKYLDPSAGQPAPQKELFTCLCCSSPGTAPTALPRPCCSAPNLDTLCSHLLQEPSCCCRALTAAPFQGLVQQLAGPQGCHGSAAIARAASAQPSPARSLPRVQCRLQPQVQLHLSPGTPGTAAAGGAFLPPVSASPPPAQHTLSTPVFPPLS